MVTIWPSEEQRLGSGPGDQQPTSLGSDACSATTHLQQLSDEVPRSRRENGRKLQVARQDLAKGVPGERRAPFVFITLTLRRHLHYSLAQGDTLQNKDTTAPTTVPAKVS